MNSSANRHVLILQGPLSSLYARLAECLEERGAQVTRINLCLGDALLWGGRPARNYRGRLENWPLFLRQLMIETGVTDLVLHGDRRPYHKAAIEVAQALGLQVAATELGLLRSGWLSIERNGAGVFSHFPEDPDAIREIANAPDDVDFAPRFKSTFLDQAKAHLAYHLTTALGRPLFPHYQRYLATNPLLDYPYWLRKLLTANARKRREADRLGDFLNLAQTGADPAKVGDLFILPLQLEGDYQVRALSPFSGMRDVMELVVQSFCQNAASNARLLVKTHPLDHGSINWSALTQEMGDKYNIANRIGCSEFHGLSTLLPWSKGLITVNSTAGFEALQAGCPVITLAPAHFDIAGMTHQSGLDTFWTHPQTPDAELVQSYCRALALTTHVRGSLFGSEGVAIAAHAMAERLLSYQLNEPGGFVGTPPRLARAKAQGCPL